MQHALKNWTAWGGEGGGEEDMYPQVVRTSPDFAVYMTMPFVFYLDSLMYDILKEVNWIDLFFFILPLQPTFSHLP